MNYPILSYSTESYLSIGTSELLVLLPDGREKVIELSDLTQIEGPFVTHDTMFLTELLRNKGLKKMIDVIDVCLIGRLLTGKKKSYRQKKRALWDYWTLLSTVPDSNIDSRSLLKIRNSFEQNNHVHQDLLIIAKLTKSLWHLQLRQLKESGEYQRFFQIEFPLNNIVLNDQIRGINICENTLINKIKTLDEEITSATSNLRFKHKLIDPKHNSDVKSALVKEGLHELSKTEINNVAKDRKFELYAKQNELVKNLILYINASRDKEILLQLGAIGTERTYPHFNSLGTITGRITLESPRLQNLKRSSRNILQPDPECSFLYPDFHQFEPGILADESGDEILISDFNSGDLYSSLSEAIYDTKNERKSAKILFLSFCNGMSLLNMASLISESTFKPKAQCKKIIDQFFGRYNRLKEWFNELELLAEREGRIGTRLGNYRYRTRRGKLSWQERRWIISQKIQGTASLILKRSIIAVYEELKQARMIIPMHDAVLWQVPNAELAKSEEHIQEIFTRIFKEECPSLNPSISFDEF